VSADGWIQEAIALGIALFAGLYVAWRLGGRPRLRRTPSASDGARPNAQVSGRLARGLRTARKRR
jgi:hypothetical protein